jgi:hypothetical protein
MLDGRLVAVGPSLRGALRALAPCLPRDLVAAASLRQIAATVGRLPVAVTGLFGFECRLGDSAATADFAFRVTRLHGGHAVLASLSAAHALPPAWREHPVWHRLGQFCAHWAEPTSVLHDNVRELWLEFDVGDASTPPVPLPSVFFGPPAARDPSGYGWVVERAIPLFRGDPLPLPTARTLRAFMDALPAETTVRHVGLMSGRPTDSVRVVVNDLPFDSLRTFLERVDWPGSSGEAHAALSPVARLAPTPKMMVSLDVGPRIGPKVGLECSLPAGAQWPSGRAGLLEYLVAEGLCVPAKRAALAAWEGWAHEPDGDAASPEQLAPLSDLVGLPARGVFVPVLSHIKVSYQPDRPLEAKAYLAVHLRWKLL